MPRDEGCRQLLTEARLGILIEDRGTLVVVVVRADVIQKCELPTRLFGPREDVVLDRRLQSERGILIEEVGVTGACLEASLPMLR